MNQKVIVTTLIVLLSISSVFSQRRYFKAIEKDNMSRFERQLRRGSDVNFQRRGDLFTPLIFASQNGKVEFVKILLENNADIDIADYSGNTALIEAIRYNHFDIAKLLADNGADLTIRNHAGETALHYVCLKNNMATKERHDVQMKIMKQIVASGISVNDSLTNGTTPLILASKTGNADIVEYLVVNNADIHKRANDGSTALGKAAYYGHLEIIKLLLNYGADIDAKSKSNFTPLILAASNNYYSVSAYLIEQGADIEYVSPSGISALKTSIINGNTGLVEIIVNALDLSLDIDNEDDNELILFAIVYSIDNSIIKKMFDSDKYYKKSKEFQNFANRHSNNAEKQKEYLLKQIENLEHSYNSLANREREYRRAGNRLSTITALSILSGIALSATYSALDPKRIWIVYPTKLDNPAMLYRIADIYKAQMAIINAKINMANLNLE